MTTGGRFTGSRTRGVDYFDDKMTDTKSAGIFQGDGIDDYDRVDNHVTQEGVSSSMHCRACNKQCNITLEWPELFIAAHTPATGIMPSGWQRSDANRALYPELKCQCGALASPIVTPEWAEKQVRAALQSGLLTEEQLARDPQVQAVQQMVAQRRQQAAGHQS